MNQNKTIVRIFTSVALVAAVTLSLSVVAQSISTQTVLADNATGITRNEITNNQLTSVLIAEKNNNMTEKTQKPSETVAEWFAEKSWFKGCKLTPSNTINLVELKKHYALHQTYWEKVFEFISKNDLVSLPVAKYTIDGDNVFAPVSEYETKLPADGKWEAHKNYIDVQIVLSGKEQIGIAPVEKATVVVPYSEAKDVMFVNPSVENDYHAKPGTFFIFFPTEAHRPNMMDGEQVKVKKIVFKVKM
jgi:biofilm protein TabA